MQLNVETEPFQRKYAGSAEHQLSNLIRCEIPKRLQALNYTEAAELFLELPELNRSTLRQIPPKLECLAKHLSSARKKVFGYGI